MVDSLRDEVYTFRVNGEDVRLVVPVPRQPIPPAEAWNIRKVEIKARLRDACKRRFGHGWLVRDEFGYCWVQKRLSIPSREPACLTA